MTTQRIFYTRPDGKVSVIVPASRYVAQFGSTAKALAAIRAKDVPADATNVWQGETTDLPHRGLFRNAWRQQGPAAPVVDMPVARGIKTDQLRVERDRHLQTLDIDYIRADEVGSTAEKRRIAGVKQQLRDLPETVQPDLDAITTPEALEVYEPSWLE